MKSNSSIKRNLIVAAIASGVLVSAPSHAAVDIAAVIDGLTDLGTAVAAIGAAMLTFNVLRFIARKTASLLSRFS